MKIKIFIAALSATVLVWLGAGYMVYDRLSRVRLNAGEDILNTPASFRITYPEWQDFDTVPYLMPYFQPVQFPSRQQSIGLSGWFIPADPGAPAVILVHGLGAGKFSSSVMLPAGMLHRHGFNVLVFDLRNHGQSAKDNGRTAIGNKEYLDVLGAWDWLWREKGFSPDRIGVYGLSLGGATALIAFSQERRLAAVFADSTFSDLPQTMREELARNHYPGFLWLPAVIVARVFFHEYLLARGPRDAWQADHGRPIYLVHGTADERISVGHTISLQKLSAMSGVNCRVWIVDGVRHVYAMFARPKEYEQVLTGFFGAALHGAIR